MYSDVLRATGHYQDHEVALFEKLIKVRHVAKDEQILVKGDVAKAIYYLLDGAVQ